MDTDTKYNFTQAENDVFAWSMYDGSNGNYLTHKASGRQIYQMHWIGSVGHMEDIVDDATRQAVEEFRAELQALQAQKPPRVEEDYDIDPEPKHSQDGYCRKCRSYCYSDCDAN